MIDLAPYKKRYDYNGDYIHGLYLTGNNGDFEKESQPRFMKDRGLKPHHMFLDLACGCLRGTAPLVEYLDDGNFHGADISPGLLKVAPDRVAALGIEKKPVLYLINNDYDFKKYMPQFDFIFSLSLFTHLLPDVVSDLFGGVAGILKPKGVYYFSMYPTTNGFDFEGDIEVARFKKEFLIRKGDEAGLVVEDIPGDYPNASPICNYIERVNFPGMAQWIMKATRKP